MKAAADEIWTRDHLLSFETGTRQVLYQVEPRLEVVVPPVGLEPTRCRVRTGCPSTVA